MNHASRNDREFGFLPFEPVIPEDPLKPLKEESVCEAPDPSAAEHTLSKELTGPGEYLWQTPRQKKRRQSFTPLAYAFAGAVLLLSATVLPLGTAATGAPPVFEPAPAPEAAGDQPQEQPDAGPEAVWEEGDPYLEFDHAYTADALIIYSYAVAPDRGSFPVTVYAGAEDAEGHTVTGDTDIWDSSRAFFDYEMDLGDLTGEITLILTEEYEKNGASVQAEYRFPVSEEAPGSEESGEPSGETPEPVSYVIPECDPQIFAFFSEIRGQVFFSQMDNVTDVRFEIYDTLTGNLFETRDITSDAIAGKYSLGEYLTDGIYQANQAAYDSGYAYPMEIRADIVMSYDTADGEDVKTVSVISGDERLHMWTIKYIPEDDPWEYHGHIIVDISNPGSEPAKVLYGEDLPEEEFTASTVLIRAEMDGKEVPLVPDHTETFNAFGQTASGEDVDLTYYDAYIPRPSGVQEGSGKEMTVFVTWFAESAGKVVTSEIQITF